MFSLHLSFSKATKIPNQTCVLVRFVKFYTEFDGIVFCFILKALLLYLQLVEATRFLPVPNKRAPDLAWFSWYSLFGPLCSVSVYCQVLFTYIPARCKTRPNLTQFFSLAQWNWICGLFSAHSSWLRYLQSGINEVSKTGLLSPLRSKPLVPNRLYFTLVQSEVKPIWDQGFAT